MVEAGFSLTGRALADDYVMTVGTVNAPLGTTWPESEVLRALPHNRLGLR